MPCLTNDTESVGSMFLYREQWRTQEFCSGGGVFNKYSSGQRTEGGSGGSSTLLRGSGDGCNLVQEISFHMVKTS